ncbi:MAG TPA: TonB-dependent receptor [Longimicrobiales bacterium]
MHRIHSVVVAAWLAAAASVAASAPAVAGPERAGAHRVQDPTGSITGVVVDRDTRQPLAGVQVYIQRLDRGGITAENGRYRLTGIPVGTYEIEAQLLGFATVRQTAQVVAGQTAVVDFALAASAISLDEVVVTSSPTGEQRRRAIGTGIASIDVETRLRDAPVTSVSQLLQGREAGVLSMASSGTAGTAGPMILRGISSLTQDNQPLIYIDGVRVDRSNTNLVSTGGQAISRLGDINPQDIDRIEIIKGAAATALYGSEASSGVIQIFTKRGRPGEITYSVGIRQGANWIPKKFPLMHPDSKYPSANDLISTGHHQEYHASIRGGSDIVSFYVAGSHVDSEGSFVSNWMKRSNGRVNLSVRPGGSVTADFSSSASYSQIRLPENDNVIYGVLTTLLLGNPVTRGTPTDPWGGAFIPVPLAIARDTRDETYRFTNGITLQHRPSEAFNQRLTLGVELVNSTGSRTAPYWVEPGWSDLKGSRNVGRRNNLMINFDYAATFTAWLSDALQSQTAVGGQFFTTRDHRVFASGTDFASPGLSALGGTTIPSVDEEQIEYTTGGLVVQEQLAYEDRLFLIVGLRADGSSAFGKDFGWQPFPKASISYVVSDEPWFELGPVSVLRLRAGFGMAGTQPGAFDAVRTYEPFTAAGGRAAIRLSNLGNADLAPEVSTEYEAGFDVGLFEDRLSLQVTGYHQTTKDVLLERSLPSSTGILTPQLTNIGTVRNVGFEASAQAILLRRGDFQWSMHGGYSYNDNLVVDLGDAPFIQVDRFGTRIVEGYPVSGKWEYVTVGTTETGAPIKSDTAVYLGPSIPPHTGNVGAEVSWGDLTVRATGQFALGHVVNHHVRPYMARLKTGEEYWRVVEAAGGDPNAVEVQNFIARNNIYGDFIEDADWFKLREITLSYTLPSSWANAIGARRATFSAAGSGLLTITKYPGTDPEVSATFGDGNNLSIGADYFTVPPQRQVLFGINVEF